MQWSYSRLARAAHVWTEDLPTWADIHPAGWVDYYVQWAGDALPSLRPARRALWGFKVGHGGHGSYGVLGGSFEPHEWPYLRIRVGTAEGLGPPCPSPFEQARVGLPLEYVGGVIAAAPLAAALGTGRVVFDQAAVHDVDSSWEVFRLLAVGVLRLLGLDQGAAPDQVLPYFGGTKPEAPHFH